jgi:hypothetical protein
MDKTHNTDSSKIQNFWYFYILRLAAVLKISGIFPNIFFWTLMYVDIWL